MASDKSFVEYVCEQLNAFGLATYKKMFGEYMVYLNGKPLFLVCDNTVYVKMREEIKNVMHEKPTGYPYPGARLHWVVDSDDNELLTALLTAIMEI